MNKYKKALTNLCIEQNGKYVIQFKKGINQTDYKLLQELVERATPREVEQEFGYYDMICPNENCNHKIDKRYQNNCGHCGQTLKWSDDE